MADLDGLLERTSRTFALAIPLLPEPTRREVTIAYLLFRVADTLEDAARWDRERRRGALREFVGLLEHPDAREASRSLSASWLSDPPLDHAGYLELLRELPAVWAELDALAPKSREIIVRHTARTSEGMAAFVARADDLGALALSNLGELRNYCYAVAGIVGELLTELFIAGHAELAAAAPLLQERASAFGEALQLVNILKDSDADAAEGRAYLPAGESRSSVLALARHDLREAAEYVLALQAHGAPRGVVAFTALAARLASATLDCLEASGPGAKLTRAEVATVVQSLGHALDHGAPAIARP